MPRARPKARTGRRLAIAGALVLLALLLVQALGPPIAARVLSSRLGRYGTVEHVSVSAWPAVKLLWGSADSVSVQARQLTLGPDRAASLLHEARDTGRLDLTAHKVDLEGLELSDVSLRKRGSALTAQAIVTAAAVTAALPRGVRIALLSSDAGSVRVRVSGGLFGLRGGVLAQALVSQGRLIARPLGGTPAALTVPLFSDPHVELVAVGASVATRSPLAYRLTLSGRLR